MMRLTIRTLTRCCLVVLLRMARRYTHWCPYGCGKEVVATMKSIGGLSVFQCWQCKALWVGKESLYRSLREAGF